MEKYTKAQMEVIEFEAEDVITTSGCNGMDVHLWCDLFYLRAAVLWCRDLPGRIKRKLCQ